jgi:hypothetical protein
MFMLRFLVLAALVAWLGTITFFSFVAAPAIFATLPVTTAGEVVGAMFPVYYRLGLIAGAVLICSSLALGLRAERRARWLTIAGLAGAMFVMTLYAAVWIQPRAAALRPALHAPGGPAAGEREEFDRLHGWAVSLNGGTLILGLGILGMTAGALRT